MTCLHNLLAFCELQGILLSVDGEGDLTVDAPQDILTPDLIEELKAQKSVLLAFLRADPVTPETRQQVYEELVERANAEYKERPTDWPPIDWSSLEELGHRILTAETMAVLLLAVEMFELQAGIVPD